MRTKELNGSVGQHNMEWKQKTIVEWLTCSRQGVECSGNKRGEVSTQKVKTMIGRQIKSKN